MDYSKIGLKSGIEIHQQLETSKLFCECPSILRVEEPDIIIKRKLHAVAGESGEIDIAAKYEHAKEREFVYEAYSDSTCLLEFDEEPPHLINKEALKIALQVSLLVNAKPLEYTQVMRKTVIDGSNTSGFQRTVLIARDGFLEIDSKKIGIASVCLEEDAARIIKQDSNHVVYRLDRLGIPLIEIATSPDISTPEEAKKVALKIGEILRACKVKRGIGTIRQDVNMSIKGGERVEIKGVQEPALISRTIETEIERQTKLIKEKKKMTEEVRRANPDGTTTFLRPLPGAHRMYPETDLPLIKINRELINEIKNSLPRLKSELKEELGETGVHEEMIKLILQENKFEEFKELSSIGIDSNLIAKALILYPKEIASHEKISIEKINAKLTLDVVETVLLRIKEKKLSENNLKHVLVEIVRGKSVEEALEIKPTSDLKSLENEIKQLIKEKSGLNVNAYMGLIMQKHKGINGKEVIEIIKKYVK